MLYYLVVLSNELNNYNYMLFTKTKNDSLIILMIKPIYAYTDTVWNDYSSVRSQWI